MKTYCIEVYIPAECEADAIERLEDLDRDEELVGYGKVSICEPD